jgi:membrane dipeptidase
MTRTILLFTLLILGIFSCTNTSSEAGAGNMSEAEIEAMANELAHEFIITDGHVDLPYRLTITNFRFTKELIGIPIETDNGDFDYKRAKQGGLDAPFMSIYIPASYQETGGAKEFADSLIDMVRGVAEAHPDKFALATSPAQVEEQFQKGLVSLPMGMENGAPVGDDLANVAYFHERGIRYITLTHSKDNQICDSSYDDSETWGGLSEFGRKVVEEMNRVGIMVDISHVSDNTFYQVMELTKAPVIASHSSCRKYTPGFERNMSDDMLQKLAENGGVIQINFGTGFLDGSLRESSRRKRNELDSILQAQNLEATDDAAQPIIEQFREDNKALMYSDVQMVANHIDNVVKVAGIDHVGLGSDFDGVGDSLPTGLKDVSQYPNLIAELLRRGYSKEDIRKICYANVWRVWNEVEQVAESM